jgi:hypothetical protein
MFSRRNAPSARFHADQPHSGIVDERIENPERVAAAADAGDDQSGRRPAAASTC